MRENSSQLSSTGKEEVNHGGLVEAVKQINIDRVRDKLKDILKDIF
jgi:hypothetical protein